MHGVSEVENKATPRPMAIFTQPDKLNYTELADAKTNLPEYHQDNVSTSPLGTQPSLPHSPLTDTVALLDDPIPWP